MAVAGLLNAAKVQMGFRTDCRRVHVDDPRLEISLRAERNIDVSGVDRRGQPVFHAVRDADRFLERVEWNHADDRAEDFFLADSHIRIAINEHCRLEKPAFGAIAAFDAMSAGSELSAL